MQFGSTVRSADGSTPRAGGPGPFLRPAVAADGLSIRLRTINVSSEDDARLLAVLQSDVFRGGLDLAASAGRHNGLLSQTLGSIATYLPAGPVTSRCRTACWPLACSVTWWMRRSSGSAPTSWRRHRPTSAASLWSWADYGLRPGTRCHRRKPEH